VSYTPGVARPAAEQPAVEEELRAALAARRDLGREFEHQLVESFVERLGRSIDERVEARLRQAEYDRARSRDARSVAIWSLVLGALITAAAGGSSGATGIAIAWVGIVLLNFAFALSRMPRH
jgi:hypothetical protein